VDCILKTQEQIRKDIETLCAIISETLPT